MSLEPRTAKRPVGFALFTIIAGAIGLFASWELLTEYIKTLAQPGYVPNCAVSILVTCGPNMDSWQGSLFGFSNTIIGVAGFMAPIFVGVALLAGATFGAVVLAGVPARTARRLCVCHLAVHTECV